MIDPFMPPHKPKGLVNIISSMIGEFNVINFNLKRKGENPEQVLIVNSIPLFIKYLKLGNVNEFFTKALKGESIWDIKIKAMENPLRARLVDEVLQLKLTDGQTTIGRTAIREECITSRSLLDPFKGLRIVNVKQKNRT